MIKNIKRSFLTFLFFSIGAIPNFYNHLNAQSMVVKMLKTASPVICITWNKDGTSFSYAENKNIIVRDSANYSLTQVIETENDNIILLKFPQSTAGEGLDQLASLSKDNVLELRILPQRKPINSVNPNSEDSTFITAPSALAYNQNGNYIATGDENGLITIYMQNYLTNGIISRELSELGTPITSLYFSRDNKLLVSGSMDSSAIIWDVASGKQLKALPYYSRTKAPVLITHDNKQILMPTAQNLIGIFDMNFNKIKEINTTENIKSIDLSADGNKLIVLCENNCFYFYDLQTCELLSYIPAFNPTPITSYAINNITSKIVLCHEDDSLYVLDIENVMLNPSDPAPEFFVEMTNESENYEVTAPEPEPVPEEEPFDITKYKAFFKDGHGISIDFGASLLPSPFFLELYIPVGYKNYNLLFPFYFGGNIEWYIGFSPRDSYPYTYKVNGSFEHNPFLNGIRIYAPVGILIYPWQNGWSMFAQAAPGISLNWIWNGHLGKKGVTSKIFPAFFAELKIGAAWDFFNFSISGRYDAILGFSFATDIGFEFNLLGTRNFWGHKREE